MNEFLSVVAAPFKQYASNTISIKDFEFSLSFGLKWMSPDNASKIKDNAIVAGLVQIKDNKLIATFDPSTVQIKAGFSPSDNVYEQFSILDQIMQMISSCSGMSNRNVAALISKKQESLADMVDIEIVALIVAKEVGCNIDHIYSKMLANLYPYIM